MKAAYILLAFLIPFGYNSQSQDFTKRYFVKTKWFSNNLDSAFYKADTIKLIQYRERNDPKWKSPHDGMDMASYLRHGERIELEFKRYKKAKILGVSKNYLRSFSKGQWTWDYDKQNNTLEIVYDGKLRYAFHVLSEKKIKVESPFPRINPINTVELTLERLR